MSKLLTIQDHDRKRIEHLMHQLHIKKQIDVVRAALVLLEQEASRLQRIKQWERATKLVAKESIAVNKAFQKNTRLKRV